MIISNCQQIKEYFNTRIYNVGMIIINLYNIKWKKKYTNKELAEYSGLSTTTITKLTKGEHVDMKLSTLERIAKFFGCSVKDIIVEVPDEQV